MDRLTSLIREINSRGGKRLLIGGLKSEIVSRLEQWRRDNGYHNNDTFVVKASPQSKLSPRKFIKQSQPKPKAYPKPQSGPQPKPKAHPKAHPKVKPGTKSKPQPNPQPKPQPGPQSMKSKEEPLTVLCYNLAVHAVVNTPLGSEKPFVEKCQEEYDGGWSDIYRLSQCTKNLPDLIIDIKPDIFGLQELVADDRYDHTIFNYLVKGYGSNDPLKFSLSYGVGIGYNEKTMGQSIRVAPMKYGFYRRGINTRDFESHVLF